MENRSNQVSHNVWAVDIMRIGSLSFSPTITGENPIYLTNAELMSVGWLNLNFFGAMLQPFNFSPSYSRWFELPEPMNWSGLLEDPQPIITNLPRIHPS